MEDSLLIISFLAILVLFVLGAIFLSEKAIVKRKLKKAVLKRIKTFKSGEIAKTTGSINFVDPPLIAPLSKRECCYYHVLVELKVQSGKRAHWKKIIELEEYNKYIISEGSDHAIINHTNLRSYIVKDKNYSSGLFNAPDNHLSQFLEEHDYTSKNWLGLEKEFRYKEGILEKGEMVAVFGQGTWGAATAFGFPASLDRVLELKAPEKSHVYLSDDPNTTVGKIKKNQALIR